MAKFKLIGGNHDHHGKLYTKGMVLSCDYDITKKFSGKFERVSRDTVVSKASAMPKDPMKVVVNPATPAPETVQDKPEPKQAVIPKATPKATPKNKPAAKKKKPAATKKAKEKAKAKKVNRGKDVTHEFPKAADEDLSVFVLKRKYYLWNKDDMSKSVAGPLNKKDIRVAINKFLEG